VSEITAHRDYTAAVQILKTEQIETRENLLNQIQALRLATVKKALSKGQLQTVAMLLKDMGAVIGEAAPEQLATNAPTLNITVETQQTRETQ
jgi:FAD synthase